MNTSKEQKAIKDRVELFELYDYCERGTLDLQGSQYETFVLSHIFPSDYGLGRTFQKIIEGRPEVNELRKIRNALNKILQTAIQDSKKTEKKIQIREIRII